MEKKDIRRGDLIFVKNKGFIFDKIRSILKSDYDHVGIMLTGNTLIDATPTKGVAIRNLTVFNSLECSIYRLSSKYQRYIDEMLNYCSGKVGCSYDIIQTISLYIMIILRIKKTLNPIDIENAFVCSELLSQAAEHSGFSFNETMATDRITPADLMAAGKVSKVGKFNI